MLTVVPPGFWVCNVLGARRDARSAVAAIAELVYERQARWKSIELGASPRGVGALIEQEDPGEVIAEARLGLLFGARYRTWNAAGDGRRPGQLGNGVAQPVADDVVTAGRPPLEHEPEDLGEIGDMDRRPMLLPVAEHDQVAGVVPG